MVSYNIDSWVEKNKDAVEKNGLDVLATSTKPIMQQLFPLCMLPTVFFSLSLSVLLLNEKYAPSKQKKNFLVKLYSGYVYV